MIRPHGVIVRRGGALGEKVGLTTQGPSGERGLWLCRAGLGCGDGAQWDIFSWGLEFLATPLIVRICNVIHYGNCDSMPPLMNIRVRILYSVCTEQAECKRLKWTLSPCLPEMNSTHLYVVSVFGKCLWFYWHLVFILWSCNLRHLDFKKVF